MGDGVNLESDYSPVTYCVSWGQFPDLSKLQFLRLYTGGDNGYHPQRVVRTMHGRELLMFLQRKHFLDPDFERMQVCELAFRAQ